MRLDSSVICRPLLSAEALCCTSNSATSLSDSPSTSCSIWAIAFLILLFLILLCGLEILLDALGKLGDRWSLEKPLRRQLNMESLAYPGNKLDGE